MQQALFSASAFSMLSVASIPLFELLLFEDLQLLLSFQPECQPAGDRPLCRPVCCSFLSQNQLLLLSLLRHFL
jgi:hypothetical protein